MKIPMRPDTVRSMKTRSLGSTGFQTSEIGFGAWAIGGSWGDQSDADSIEALTAAIDAGVNFIDTAAGYGNGKSERIIGKFLKERAEDVFVATKTPPVAGPWPPSPYCKAEERYPEAYLRDMAPGQTDAAGTISSEAVEELIARRLQARREKDWAEADRIRDELDAAGIILEDGASGTRWRRS